jgi:hypothetical protein
MPLKSLLPRTPHTHTPVAHMARACLQVRAMYDAYRSPSVGLQDRQLLAWEMIMARGCGCITRA